MSKIKFHLNKFDKRLYFQLIDIDSSLLEKAYLKAFDEYTIVIGSVSNWSQQFDLYESGANFGSKIGRTHNKSYLLSSYTKCGAVIHLSFDTNEERDLFYDRVIDMYKISIDNNLWVNNE